MRVPPPTFGRQSGPRPIPLFNLARRASEPVWKTLSIEAADVRRLTFCRVQMSGDEPGLAFCA